MHPSTAVARFMQYGHLGTASNIEITGGEE